MDSELIVASASLFISLIAFLFSWQFWRKQFRPIVTAMVKTNHSGNVATVFDLVLTNSGQLPAFNIKLKVIDDLDLSALAEGASEESRKRWLACFEKDRKIVILQNGSSTCCSFGFVSADQDSFWKYEAEFRIEITYESWLNGFFFRRQYIETQTIKIQDSASFTGFKWA